MSMARAERRGVTSGIKESPNKVGTFSPDARDQLSSQGYLIYSLSGKSIRELEAEGNKFWSTWHRSQPRVEDVTSSIGEVAINPAKIFIDGSNLKSVQDQNRLVEELSEKLQVENKGLQAMVGNIADNAELFFLHLKTTGEDLFGGKYARTTQEAFSNPVFIGGAMGDKLGIVYWQPVFECSDFFTAPLIIPSK
ncbi:MAG: hypothetical protein A2W22_05955 [Candidatus Levybacteria bacterium RBG_16_35_11]|nr:MAG: hypothetical protein A2W22_05955 [Candidatus Levybacteria bacterium RBG_16_35_11]